MERIENLLKIRFDSEPVYGDNDKYIKTKIKIWQYNYKFSRQKMPIEKAPCKCLSIIMLDFVTKAKEIKHFWKNTNMNQKRQKWRTLLMMIQKKV